MRAEGNVAAVDGRLLAMVCMWKVAPGLSGVAGWLAGPEAAALLCHKLSAPMPSCREPQAAHRCYESHYCTKLQGRRGAASPPSCACWPPPWGLSPASGSRPPPRSGRSTSTRWVLWVKEKEEREGVLEGRHVFFLFVLGCAQHGSGGLALQCRQRRRKALHSPG